MAADLESQSIQILNKESDLLFESEDQHSSPERIFTSFQLPSGTRVDETLSKEQSEAVHSKDGQRGSRQAGAPKAFHFNSRSLDSSFFKLELCAQNRSKLAFPVLPGPKPSVLAMILKGRTEASLLPKKTSECNVWHNPKVPRVLVNYLLDRQLKKPELLSQDFDLKSMKHISLSTQNSKGSIGGLPNRTRRLRKLQIKKPHLLPPLRIVPYKGDKKAVNRSESSLY